MIDTIKKWFAKKSKKVSQFQQIPLYKYIPTPPKITAKKAAPHGGGPSLTSSSTAIPNFTSSLSSSSFKSNTFSIGFSWGGKTKTITLENGEDVFKLADILKALLTAADVPYKEEIN